MQLFPELIFLFILLVWLIGLSLYTWRLKNQYKVFLGSSKQQTLSGFLESVSSSLLHTEEKLRDTTHRLEGLEKENRFHIQKIGLLRFNPFRDTGGDQSFVLSLVDAYDTGVVVSALYSRSGTRWYAKKVVNGKGEEYDLSAEEEKAIKLAKTIKKP
jgi:hypothetical protein